MTSASDEKKSKSAFGSLQGMSTAPLNVPARDETVAGAGVTTSKDIIRDAAGREGTVSLSSERFNFVNTEESGVVDSIDQANQLFTGFTKKPPTLEEALRSMEYEKAKELTELFTKKASDKLAELDAPGLTVEDIAAIFCYTFEWTKRGLAKERVRTRNSTTHSLWTGAMQPSRRRVASCSCCSRHSGNFLVLSQRTTHCTEG